MYDYKVSIVIATYNSTDSLIKLVDSIKEQSIGFDNIELLLVDDNSTNEDTINLIQAYGADLNNCSFILLDENHDFPGAARNEGLKIASGEFIIFADHDDSYEKDAFEVLYNKAKENNADLVFSNHYKVFPNKKIPVDTVFNGKEVIIDDISEEKRLLELSPSIWTKLFKKEFLFNKDIQFLERMLAEDLYVFIHALLTSSKTVYLDDFYSYNYSIRDSSKDKSTIHLRTKKILESMINGYFKTDDLLKQLSKEEYFSIIFQNHFVYWITSLIISDLSNDDKIYLLKKISPLFIKYLSINGDFGEKIYDPLIKPLLNEDYTKLLKTIKYLKFRRKISKLF